MQNKEIIEGFKDFEKLIASLEEDAKKMSMPLLQENFKLSLHILQLYKKAWIEVIKKEK